jgi:sugar phosphate isomerase/epimerase
LFVDPSSEGTMMRVRSPRPQQAVRRRDALGRMAGALALPWMATPAGAPAQQPEQRSRLGLVIYCCLLRQRARARENSLAEPLNFLEHCRRLGAGGMQVSLGAREQAYAAELRRRAAEHGMFIEGMAALPRDQADLERFQAEVRTAKQADARAIRVVAIAGRRYERFDSAEAFRQASEHALRALERAEPVAARYQMPLAVENHKDQRVPERLAVLRRLSSEYVGMCMDTGNSFALLEDPL